MKLIRWFSLPFLMIFIVFASHGNSAVISPDLQSALEILTDQDEISVIVTFSDKVDFRLFKDKEKSLRRSLMLKDLKAKADLTQRPFKTFLESRKAKKIKSLWLINGMALTADPYTIRELIHLPGVEKIRLDGTIQAPGVAYEVSAIPEWNLHAIRAPELWILGYTGVGTVVASLDTGVDLNHPDLQSKWRGGMNSWYDPYGEHTAPYDANGHGTQVMGISVGGDAGGTAIGVAPEANWIAVKVFNDANVATLSGIHLGFQWLFDPDGNPDTNDTPDVVIISWGLGSVNECSLEFQPDLQAMKAAEIAVALSAGNSGPNSSTSISPANNPGGFAIGAVGGSLEIAPFSSRGPSPCDGSFFPELVAPGVNIKTADLTFGGGVPNSYTVVSGTSFSAPHVAGAIALLLNAFPTLTVTELELVLKQSALDRGTPGPDNDYGYGFLDVVEAYRLVLNPFPNISTLPSTYTFPDTKEGRLSSQIFNVYNRGIEDLFIGQVSITGTHASEFFIQNDRCSEQALILSDTCSIHVTFSPLSGGPKRASLSIPSNDPDQNPLDVALIATGIEQYRLSIMKAGEGTGQVKSTTPGIDCGNDCMAPYDPGMRVLLNATPDAESIFGGWSGCDWSFLGKCSVSMNTDKIITPAFISPKLTLTAPNGGEEWKTGSLEKIKWSYTGNPGSNIRIELLKGNDLQTTIRVNRRGGKGAGYRYWRIPEDLPTGNDYKIRITSTSNSAYTDTSDSSFMVIE